MKFIILLLLLSFTSVISVNYAYAEEIGVTIESKKDHYFLNEPLVFNVTVEKYIPNSRVSIAIYSDGQRVGGFETNSKYLKENERNVRLVAFPLCSVPSSCPQSGIYEVLAYYGSIEDPFGTDTTSFSFNEQLDTDSKFIMNNYFPTKFDVGSDWEPKLFFNQDFRKYCIDMIPNCQKFHNMGYHHYKTGKLDLAVNISYYEKGNNPKFEDVQSCYGEETSLFCTSLATERSDYKCGEDHYKDILSCDNNFFHIAIKYYRDLSYKTTSLFMTSVLEKIEQNPITGSTTPFQTPNLTYNYSPTHIENFPDSTKSPQYYLNRYNNEPTYKDWFDSQFPDTTLSDVLAEKESEKPKIPDWIKNIMQWYLDGVISEDEMISAIEFLIKEGIIKVD